MKANDKVLLTYEALAILQAVHIQELRKFCWLNIKLTKFLKLRKLMAESRHAELVSASHQPDGKYAWRKHTCEVPKQVRHDGIYNR